MKLAFTYVIVLLLVLPVAVDAADTSQLVPAGWDPALAGDVVMQRLVTVTAPRVKGAHDAEFVCVGDRAYIVAEVNDVRPGEGGGWPEIYCAMSIVNLRTLAVERVITFAHGEQAFENVTLPRGACFVPRILAKDQRTLRCYFAIEHPGKGQAQTWFRDFDIASGTFEKQIHKACLKTTAGTFPMQPRYFHADAVAQGFTKPAKDYGLYLFDSFKQFDGRTYVAINNFPGKQNALALVHDDLATFEILGHYNEPQSEQLSESAVNRLPDGTWMAICRNDAGNYHFSTSADGETWTAGREMLYVPNGANAKPTFDRFGGIYYLGWQEKTRFQGVGRSVFNVDISRDGKTWDRKYRFETPKSFQYPTFHEHAGVIWLSVTQGDSSPSRKERIMFGRLEDVGQFESQAGRKRLTRQRPGEKLSNGIVLPEVWPPRHLDPNSDEPMPVPYLQHPPSVISIDVGRQLFVDDFLIESTTLRRTLHRAKKFEGNPVFRAETKHELAPSSIGEKGQQAVTYLGHGGVFYDPAARQFKMFYTAGWRGPLALATSTDLIHWTRPDLGLLEDNLLLAQGDDAGGDNSVWLDLASRDERIKLLTDRGKEGHFLQTSPDGRAWSTPVPTGKAGDYCSIFYNPFRDVWCYSIKQGGRHGRNRWYHESPDFLKGADWSQSVFWANADRLDQPDPEIGDPPQLYSLSAVAYESLMLGMFQIHLGPNNRICDAGQFPKLTELKLGFSRDGFHWHRPDRRPFIAATRQEGTWDRAYLHTTTGVFVVLDDQLVFPYCAYSGIAPNGHRGMYTGGAIGIATLRRDGFASMRAENSPGTLTTRPVVFCGQHLFVNLAASGDGLSVEMLDAAGNVLATSKRATGDQTKLRIQWTDRTDLAEFAKRPVRFRFRLTTGGHLYAFWVTQDAGGASNGYLAAGGPGFSGTRDTAEKKQPRETIP